MDEQEKRVWKALADEAADQRRLPVGARVAIVIARWLDRAAWALRHGGRTRW